MANGANGTNGNGHAPLDPRKLGSAGVLTLVVGLVAGFLLYLPWDTIWDLALKRLSTRLPGVRLQWQSVDRAGPLSFRINGLSAEAAGWPFSPRLAALDVRLGVSPRLALRADTGGATLSVVALDSGDFTVQGAANLSCLGRRDIRGSVDVRCEGRADLAAGALAKAFLDLRGSSLQLPGGLLLGDAALAVEYAPGELRIRSFTLRAPVQVRAEGTAQVTPGALLDSPYTVAGELFRGRDSFPFSAQGVLGDFLGEAALPR